MNTKWYISTFIILLALIGLNQEQTKVANQQIVVQFADAESTSASTCDTALAKLTQKLEVLGITNIEVLESNATELTIRYYSTIDAQRVGKFLSQDSGLSLIYENIDDSPFDFPEDELPESISLVVSDLQQNSGDGFGLNGKFAFELKQEYKTYQNPDIVALNNNAALRQCARAKVAFKTYAGIAIALDNTLRTIPEVRAGPCV